MMLMKYYDWKPFWRENLQDLLSSPYCDKTGTAPVVKSAGNKC